MKQPRFILSAIAVVLQFAIGIFAVQDAGALPAFARKEGVTCVMCHANSSAPHLNEMGYMYRRMAFHIPGKLGDEASDEKGQTATNHMAAGVNVNYDYATATADDGTKTTSANGISVPEVELWPLVGGFMGNWGMWDEIVLSPTTNTGGEVGLEMADIRYAFGTNDLFYNFRGGMMSAEGIGASDQWLDDGNIPLVDIMTPNYNQDTLVTPWGAMGMPQLGVEAGVNFSRTYLTLGLYNGFTAVKVDPDTGATSSDDLKAANPKHNDKGMRDYRVQVDKFIGSLGVVTAGYYHGTTPLMSLNDPNVAWLNHFDSSRLYLTAYVIPGKLDLLGGMGMMKNEHVPVAGSDATDGTFNSQGQFVGAAYYVSPHLTLTARADWFKFNTTDKASGYSVQAELPYLNNIFVIHYNHVTSDIASGDFIAGKNDSAGVSFRFLL